MLQHDYWKKTTKKHYLCLIFGVLCKYIVSLYSWRWNCVTTNYSWFQTRGTRKFYERSGVRVRIKVKNHCSKRRKYSGQPELLRSEISFLRTCNIPKQYQSTQTRSYLNELCILLVLWYDCIFIIYFTKFVIHWKRQLLSPKMIILTKTNTGLV